LLTLGACDARFIVPAPAATIGERRRICVIAGDMSLAREPSWPSSTLNMLPRRIGSAKSVDEDEIVVMKKVPIWQCGARARVQEPMTTGPLIRPRCGGRQLRADIVEEVGESSR
jgi:ABC-type molybdate transport system ATPase subunit